MNNPLDAALDTDDNGPKDPHLVRLSEVQRESLDFLLAPYIPLRKVTILEGDPGLGKSFVTLALATAISHGESFAKDRPVKKGKVMLFCPEDGFGDTIRPRLEAMGADLDQIVGYTSHLSLDDDGKNKIVHSVMKVRPNLVILDPLTAFFGTAADMNKANHARAFMAWLGRLAEKNNCAVLVVRHLTKGGRDQAAYRGLGSIDFTAAARSVLMFVADPSNRDGRGIFHTKSNLAKPGDPIGYIIGENGILWTGAPSFDLGAALQPDTEGDRNGVATDTAMLVKKLLESGPKAASEIEEHVRQQVGSSKRTLMRVKKSLGVVSEKDAGEGGCWRWRLP